MWPFSFGETLTIISTVTTGIAAIIAAFARRGIDKVHTIVNQEKSDREALIKTLQDTLTNERAVTAAQIRQDLIQEIVTAVNTGKLPPSPL